MKIIIILLSFCLFLSSQNHLKYGIPGNKGKIIYKTGYVLSYSTKTKNPIWVSYELSKQYLYNSIKRTDNFRSELATKRGFRAELIDFKGSGYDRGHLAPAADMKQSLKTMSESFLLINISPQKPSFNRGIWRVLETKVRDYVKINTEAWIITGPVFMDIDKDGNRDRLGTIGPNNVYIPTHYYKIIVSENQGKLTAYAFILPNQKSINSVGYYNTTIDYIEHHTGLDFLNKLPDDLENKIESRKPNNLLFWQKSNSKPRYKTTTSIKQKQSSGNSAFHGNTSSKIYHGSKCRYYKCFNCSKKFNSKQEALNGGYRACKMCIK
jgi:endonuclease G